MLNKVKLALRVDGTVFDEEIQDLIDACKLDLGIGGVDAPLETDALIARAVVLYCKAHFGLDNPNSEKYLESYTSLKTSLSLAGDYRSVLERTD